MNSESFKNFLILGVVIFLHGTILAVALGNPSEKKVDVQLPSIQGVLLPSLESKPVEKKEVTVQEKEKPKAISTVKLPKPSESIKTEPIKAEPIKNEVVETLNEQSTVVDDTPLAETEAKTSSNLGEPITLPQIEANSLNNPAPPYPKLSRRLKEQGRVLLEILILPDGSVGEVKLKETSGFSRLDKVAIQAIKKWRYLPARRGDQPIEYWYLQPLEFSLN